MSVKWSIVGYSVWNLES